MPSIPPNRDPFDDLNSRFHQQQRNFPALRRGEEPHFQQEEQWAVLADFSVQLQHLSPLTVLILQMMDTGQSDQEIARHIRRIVPGVNPDREIRRARELNPPDSGGLDVTG